MSASEQPEMEAGGRPEEDKARPPAGGPWDGAREVPLFLRGLSDGRKGDAQDEKDEAGE